MRVLYVTSYHRTGGWLAEAFAADSAVDVVLEEAVGVAAGMSRLRDEVFDAVLISHEPGELDALAFLEGFRAGGSEEPLIVLGEQSEQQLTAECYEVGADAYVCVNTTTTRNLIWMVARAVERRLLIRENRRLAQAERQRLRLEHDEAQRLLEDQRLLLRDLEQLRAAEDAGNSGTALAASIPHETTAAQDILELPSQLVEHYRQLLKAYVIMGSGNLAQEMSTLADLLTFSGISAPQSMQLHLHVVDELIRGLGTRSARHVVTRADLLALEVMVHLCEGYRERYHQRCQPPRQLMLPGLAQPAEPAFS
jgi:DNA-binding response OmpR family regulator